MVSIWIEETNVIPLRPDLQSILERKSVEELVAMLESAKAIYEECLRDDNPEVVKACQPWYISERAGILNALRVRTKGPSMRKTRTGLQITGGITLREWLVIQDKDPETDPGIRYVEDLFGRLVITMSQDEQEHVKRFLRGLITEAELLLEVRTA